jgi:hypothetical protein
MSEREEVGRCKIKGVGMMREDPQAFFRGVDPRIIRMNGKLSLLLCQVEQDEACKNTVMVLPPCKTATFWKCVEQVESELNSMQL